MSEEGRFQDRREAGRRLAEALSHLTGSGDVVVLGLPRGGVPVAFEVAAALDAPLDVFVVRKLGVPSQPELAMGALASGGVRVLNEDVLGAAHLTDADIDEATSRELEVLERQESELRGGCPRQPLTGRVAILVDDGLATGATMRAAIEALRAQEPSRVVVAIPTAPAEACRALAARADEVVCLTTPASFVAVGAWYRDFAPVSDQEVRDLLAQSAV